MISQGHDTMQPVMQGTATVTLDFYFLPRGKENARTQWWVKVHLMKANSVGPKIAVTSCSPWILSNTYVFTHCHHPTALKTNKYWGFSSSRRYSCVDGWLGSGRFEASRCACIFHHPTTTRGIPQDTNSPKLSQTQISHNFHCLHRFRCFLETRQLACWSVHLREKL